jgi:hypothetical protein
VLLQNGVNGIEREGEHDDIGRRDGVTIRGTRDCRHRSWPFADGRGRAIGIAGADDDRESREGETLRDTAPLLTRSAKNRHGRQ